MLFICEEVVLTREEALGPNSDVMSALNERGVDEGVSLDTAALSGGSIGVVLRTM